MTKDGKPALVLGLPNRTPVPGRYDRTKYQRNKEEMIKAIEPWVAPTAPIEVSGERGATLGALIYTRALGEGLAKSSVRGLRTKNEAMSAYTLAWRSERKRHEERAVVQYLMARHRALPDGYMESLAEWKTMDKEQKDAAVDKMVRSDAWPDRTSNFLAEVYVREINKQSSGVCVAAASGGGGVSACSRRRAEDPAEARTRQDIRLFLEYKAAKELLEKNPGVGMDMMVDVVEAYSVSTEGEMSSDRRQNLRALLSSPNDLVSSDARWYIAVFSSTNETALSERIRKLQGRLLGSRQLGNEDEAIRKARRQLHAKVAECVMEHVLLNKKERVWEAMHPKTKEASLKLDTVMREAWRAYLRGSLPEEVSEKIRAYINQQDTTPAPTPTPVAGSNDDWFAGLIVDALAALKGGDLSAALVHTDSLREAFAGTNLETPLSQGAEAIRQHSVGDAFRYLSFSLHVYNVTVLMVPGWDKKRASTATGAVVEYSRSREKIVSLLSDTTSSPTTGRSTAMTVVVVPSSDGNMPGWSQKMRQRPVVVGGLIYPGYTEYMTVAMMAHPSSGLSPEVVYPCILRSEGATSATSYGRVNVWDIADSRFSSRLSNGKLAAVLKRSGAFPKLLATLTEEHVESDTELTKYLISSGAFMTEGKSTMRADGVQRYVLSRAVKHVYSAAIEALDLSELAHVVCAHNIQVVYLDATDTFLGVGVGLVKGDNVLGSYVRQRLDAICARNRAKGGGGGMFSEDAKAVTAYPTPSATARSVFEEPYPMLGYGHVLDAESIGGMRWAVDYAALTVASLTIRLHSELLAMQSKKEITATECAVTAFSVHFVMSTFLPFDHFFCSNEHVPANPANLASLRLARYISREVTQSKDYIGVGVSTEAAHYLADIAIRSATAASSVYATTALAANQSVNNNNRLLLARAAVNGATPEDMMRAKTSVAANWVCRKMRTHPYHMTKEFMQDKIDKVRINMHVYGYPLPFSRRGAAVLAMLHSYDNANTIFLPEDDTTDPSSVAILRSYPRPWIDRRVVTRSAFVILASLTDVVSFTTNMVCEDPAHERIHAFAARVIGSANIVAAM